MENIFDYTYLALEPYTHPMLIPVTAFGYPVEPNTKTDPVGGESREPEQFEEKIFKERLHLFDSNIMRTNQGESS
jgi:hypothetical protein